jgi:hypothetical protein
MTEFNPPPVSSDDKGNGGEPTVSFETWSSIDCCCDNYPGRFSSARSKVPSGVYLVYDERLPKILDELGDSFRVLRFIEDPPRPSFPLQLLSALLDTFQGSTGD